MVRGGTPTPDWREKPRAHGERGDGEKRRMGLEETWTSSRGCLSLWSMLEGWWNGDPRRGCTGGGDVGSWEIYFIWGV